MERKPIDALKDTNPIVILEDLLKRHCIITPQTIILDYNCVPAFDLHMTKFGCMVIAACASENLKRHALKVINYNKFGVCSHQQLNNVDVKFDYVFVVDFPMRRTYIRETDLKTIYERIKPEGKFILVHLPFCVDDNIDRYFDTIEKSEDEFFMQNLLVMKKKETVNAE